MGCATARPAAGAARGRPLTSPPMSDTPRRPGPSGNTFQAVLTGAAAGPAPGEVVRRGALWGAFAFAPAACLVAVVAALVLAPAPLAATMRTIAAEPVALLALFLLIGGGHCVAFAWHAVRNPRLAGARRARWVIALALAPGVMAPLYWWRGLTATAP